MAGLENMSFIAIGVSIYTYFFGYMNFSLTKSANTLTNFMGTAYLLSLFGGFVSDTYLSRFKTSVLFGLLEAHFEQLRPTPCKDITSNILGLCEKPTKSQEALLFAGLYLVAFGISGTKAAGPALGADQFDEKDPKEAAKLPTYFNFLIFAMTFGAIIGTTLLVWINQNEGWDLAFGICTISLFAGILILIAGRSVYRHNVLQGSPLVRIMRVLVVAIFGQSSNCKTNNTTYRTMEIMYSDTSRGNQNHSPNAPNNIEYHFHEHMSSSTSNLLCSTKYNFGPLHWQLQSPFTITPHNPIPSHVPITTTLRVRFRPRCPKIHRDPNRYSPTSTYRHRTSPLGYINGRGRGRGNASFKGGT
ncbi:hypothetical protein Leryth_003667 [Lithospermum erythrorhizon]|nr:hypothetical protein Leryth_003667 [Lithospermum erythrorhizon]